METKTFPIHSAIYDSVRYAHIHNAFPNTMSKIIEIFKSGADVKASQISEATIRKYTSELVKSGAIAYNRSDSTYSVSKTVEFDPQRIAELRRGAVKKKVRRTGHDANSCMPDHVQALIQGAKSVPTLNLMLTKVGMNPDNPAHLYAAIIAVSFSENETKSQELLGRLASLIDLASSN